jgi:hypothetical protein
MSELGSVATNAPVAVLAKTLSTQRSVIEQLIEGMIPIPVDSTTISPQAQALLQAEQSHG